jgi:6-phosphogluconate dehydrogenase
MDPNGERDVELGMIGLGRMGANMVQRLVSGGHRVTGYDRSAEAVQRVTSIGAEGAESLQTLVARLRRPRAVWIMVPAGKPVDEIIDRLLPALEPGDTIIDGGNSFYRDTQRRAETTQAAGLHFVDVGTSGGIWGLAEGFCLMIGGDPGAVERLRPVFETLAPAAERGWGHVGPAGAGHFTKMVHNGIEYGMMQAYAEGFAIMEARRELALDLAQIAEIWRHGSVVRSWLLDLTAEGLARNAQLDEIAPRVDDSGEGRWTVAEAIALDVPAPVITLALQARLRSRVDNSYADRLLALMRQQFGGHAIHRQDSA